VLSFRRSWTKIYAFSTECQGGEFAPTGIYSPRFNDIWSLGVILLNLATGRNPWKSATAADPTFQAYLQDPLNFLPNVLPISPELNDILVRVLDVDWPRRLTLRQFRRAIENLDSFYADGVVFEGSLARCPWEVGIDLSLSDEPSVGKVDLPRRAMSAGESFGFKSRWSDDTDESDIVFTEAAAAQDALRHGPWSPMVDTPDPGRRTWLAETLGLSKYQEDRSYSYGEWTPSITHSPPSPYLSDSSVPTTPENTSRIIGIVEGKSKPALRHKLTIDTALVSKPRYYDSSDVTSFETVDGVSPTSSSAMHTAVEQVSYPSSFTMASSRGSDIFLQSPESIDLGSIIVPDVKDLGPGVPWNFSRVEPVAATAAAVAEVTFASRYPSTQESYDSVSSSVEAYPDYVLASPRDYFTWSGFYERKVSDGGGGRSSGEPYDLGARQASWSTRKGRRVTSPDGRSFNPFARMGSRSPSPEAPHPQRSHERKTSEPLVFSKLRHREDHGKGTLRRRLDSYLHPQNAQSPHAQADSQNAFPEAPPAALQQDKRSAKPWFLPSLFCLNQHPQRWLKSKTISFRYSPFSKNKILLVYWRSALQVRRLYRWHSFLYYLRGIWLV
jgi:hypothetical protein